MQDRGIVLVGTGRKYVNEIYELTQSIKQFHPELPITVFVDENIQNHHQYDSVRRIMGAHHSFMDKVKYMYQSPYNKTLFLDTDILLLDRIDELFDLLDRFDVVAPIAPIDEEREKVPVAFPELNTGVILFRKSDTVKNFFHEWMKLHEVDILRFDDYPPDQPSFRETLYRSSLQACLLSLEYNCMMDYPCVLYGKVKILHGRRKNKQLIACKINEYPGCRTYIPNIGILYGQEETQIILC